VERLIVFHINVHVYIYTAGVATSLPHTLVLHPQLVEPTITC